MHPVDSLAPIALHVILALIAGALVGSAWDAWREHRRRGSSVVGPAAPSPLTHPRCSLVHPTQGANE